MLYQSIPVGNQPLRLIFQILQFVSDLKFKIKNGSLQRHHIGCRFSFIHTEKFKIPAQVKDIEFLLIFSAQYPGAKAGYKALPGSPDIVLTKYKIAIFCDSEFFHGKDLEQLKLRLEKGNNPDNWIKKIERNRTRDWGNDKKLLFLGYSVLHFWGQDIKKHTAECLQVVEEAIWDNQIMEIDDTSFDLQ